MRRFVVIGSKAEASGDFRLEDLPGTSGRLDVLLRCVRAALLRSHGLRRDVVVYLVLLGGARAPRALRIDGATAKFIRPDERSLATLARKVLTTHADETAQGFVEVKPGVAVARGGLDAVLADLGAAARYVLDEGGTDVRDEATLGGESGDVAFFLGDHEGFDATTRAQVAELGAKSIALGPVSVHADDAIAILSNELDRRAHVAMSATRRITP